MALAATGVGEVVALTRRPLTAPHGKAAARFKNVVVDFASITDSADSADWAKVDGVICTLGTTIKVAGSKTAFSAIDLDLPVQIARVAKAAGASRFGLNSSLGAKASSGNFYLSTKGKAEDQIRQLDYPSLIIVRPSLIDTQRSDVRIGEQVGLLAARVLGPIIPRQYRPVTSSVIAQALLDGVLTGKPGVTIVESGELQN